MTESDLYPRACRPRHAGYSLVELVMTLVLVGIIAAIGVPRFFERGTFDERGFFDEVISAMRYAQKTAIASCSPVRVNVNNNTYTLFRANAPGNCNNPCTVAATGTNVTSPVDPAQNFTGTAPDGITITPNANIVFCSAGTANATQVFAVGGRQITISAATGFVEGQ